MKKVFFNLTTNFEPFNHCPLEQTQVRAVNVWKGGLHQEVDAQYFCELFLHSSRFVAAEWFPLKNYSKGLCQQETTSS